MEPRAPVAPSRRGFGIIFPMKKRTREKVALLVFALLVVLGGSVLLRYFETGRSFNMAATAVDDAFGQMSGYTAIVFDGTYDVLDALRPTKLPSVDGTPTSVPRRWARWWPPSWRGCRCPCASGPSTPRMCARSTRRRVPAFSR